MHIAPRPDLVTLAVGVYAVTWLIKAVDAVHILQDEWHDQRHLVLAGSERWVDRRRTVARNLVP